MISSLLDYIKLHFRDILILFCLSGSRSIDEKKPVVLQENYLFRTKSRKNAIAPEHKGT